MATATAATSAARNRHEASPSAHTPMQLSTPPAAPASGAPPPKPQAHQLLEVAAWPSRHGTIPAALQPPDDVSSRSASTTQRAPAMNHSSSEAADDVAPCGGSTTDEAGAVAAGASTRQAAPAPTPATAVSAAEEQEPAPTVPAKSQVGVTAGRSDACEGLRRTP